MIAAWGRGAEAQPVRASRPPATPAAEPEKTSPDTSRQSRPPTAPVALARRLAPKPRPTLGKGGPEHKHLQSLLKHCAESKGFRVTIESPVTGGGEIDVRMERDALKVACELSITTEPVHEAGNVRKCLASGATHILVVSPTEAALKRIEKTVKASGVETADRVEYMEPADVLGFLEMLGPATPETTTVRGYKVKTTVEGSKAGPAKSTVGRTIVQALRQMRGK